MTRVAPLMCFYRIKILRDAWTLNVFHDAFKDGLMGYGMIYGTKKPAASA